MLDSEGIFMNQMPFVARLNLKPPPAGVVVPAPAFSGGRLDEGWEEGQAHAPAFPLGWKKGSEKTSPFSRGNARAILPHRHFDVSIGCHFRAHRQQSSSV